MNKRRRYKAKRRRAERGVRMTSGDKRWRRTYRTLHERWSAQALAERQAQGLPMLVTYYVGRLNSETGWVDGPYA